MSGSLAGIALTGLTTAQGGLVTTGHNIANANTPGYSRQQSIQAANTPQLSGAGYFGRGVGIEDVRRSYDEFLVAQSRSAQASASHWDTSLSQLQAIDGMLADPDVGLAPALAGFFQSVQNVATSPADASARQSMLSASQSLAGRVRDLDRQLAQLRVGTEQGISNAVASVNSLTARIAELNERIALAGVDSHAPNDLLDQRDAVVADLNKLVRANVVQQSDGGYNLFLATGQALVVGTRANALATAPDNLDAEKLSVGIQTGASLLRFRATDAEGGELGGLLAFRDGALESTQNAIGRVAMVLAASFNRQHHLGIDRNGQYGADFFAAGAPRATASSANSGNAQLSASIADFGALTESNYRVQYDGVNWNVTRQSDGTLQSFATLPQTVDGVTIAIASGSASAGDDFLVLPTRNGAGIFAALLTNSAQIAAAAPIRTAAANGNAGTATVTAGQVIGPNVNANLQQPVTISFTGPGIFNVTGTGTGNPVGVAYASGGSISYNGWSLQISGTPAAGDSFTISVNAGGAGDNRNMRLLGDLQNSLLVGGTATLAGSYGQLVAQVGNATHDAEVSATAQQRFLDEAQSRQQSVSGVNLDEEAANLLRYQQAYQAAGKLVSIADQLFKSLLDLGN